MGSLNRIVICPYTLMAEEALAWSVLLFYRVLLLHPYPLPLPLACGQALEQGRLQVLTLPRTPEEIREKDRVLRELERYSTQIPGKEYLQYLAGGAVTGKDLETQEEILAALRGKGNPPGPEAGKEGLDGALLLCGIHHWMLQEWELDRMLAAVEEQERGIIRGLIGEEETETPWKMQEAKGLRGFELKSPWAFKAWQEMKDRLIPEPLPRITDQAWVWKEHYGREPEDYRSLSLPLPPLPSFPEALALAQQQALFRGIIQDLLNGPSDSRGKGLTALKEGLTLLGLSGEGAYTLVPPPPVPEGEEKERVFLLFSAGS